MKFFPTFYSFVLEVLVDLSTLMRFERFVPSVDGIV